MQDYFRVGVICGTHGLAGEVKVYPTTQDVKRFSQLKEVYLDTKSGYQKLCVEKVRFFKQFVIVKFQGIDDINDVEKYKGLDMNVLRKDAIPLAENEYYIADIIGAEVFTEDGAFFGVLTDVLETGANLVYVVEHEKKEVLLPAIHDCVREVDTENQRVVVHIMKGLLDE